MTGKAFLELFDTLTKEDLEGDIEFASKDSNMSFIINNIRILKGVYGANGVTNDKIIITFAKVINNPIGDL